MGWPLGLGRRSVIVAVVMMTILLTGITLVPKDPLLEQAKTFLDTNSDAATPAYSGTKSVSIIRDKVAVITDTTFTSRHVPLIMHFHAVLGPEWPIYYFTSQETYDNHLKPDGQNTSAIWSRAMKKGWVQVQIIPERFNLTSRRGVNLYLGDKWLWEQLAPAKHVLVFQADAIICANAPKTADDFLEWDFIGATLRPEGGMWNGGLSLRNRTMMLDILSEFSFEKESSAGSHGEDVWFSEKMAARGAHLPDNDKADEFAAEYQFHFKKPRHPLGYHKIHRRAGNRLKQISEWCPEIILTAPGPLVHS